jgi:hypothetical protein
MIFRTMATFIQLKTVKTLDKFKKFKAEVENQHDLKIKIVRSDWGGTTVDICWGYGKEAARRSPTKLYLAYGTFASVMTINTSAACFTGRYDPAQRRRSSSAGGLVSVHLSGGPRGIRRLL